MKQWHELTIEEKEEWRDEYLEEWGKQHPHQVRWTRLSFQMEEAKRYYEEVNNITPESFDFEKAWSEMFLNESFD